MVAALFVETDGAYFGLDQVDPWDIERDAKTYTGPWPVVAHPPCERWGRYWNGGPSARVRRELGDDNGCFEFALAAVRKWGGVLEHPEGSHAFKKYHIPCPPRGAGWIPCLDGGFVCCVEQGHYGHKARKATWLYAYGVELPKLNWTPSEDKMRLDDGYHSAEERRRAIKTGTVQRLSKRQRAATPLEFRDMLIAIAASAVT